MYTPPGGILTESLTRMVKPPVENDAQPEEFNQHARTDKTKICGALNDDERIRADKGAEISVTQVQHRDSAWMLDETIGNLKSEHCQEQPGDSRNQWRNWVEEEIHAQRGIESQEINRNFP